VKVTVGANLGAKGYMQVKRARHGFSLEERERQTGEKETGEKGKG
jgi:hypothetical protein